MPVMPRDRESAFQIQQQQTLLQRNRSYSTPYINCQVANRTLQQQQQPQHFPQGGAQQGGVPAVPGIPAHLTHTRHDSATPRSHSNSPANEMQLPLRTSTQSPGQGQRGKTPQLYPAQPPYGHRTGTPSQSGLSGVPMSTGTPPVVLAPLAPVDNQGAALLLGTGPLPTSASTASSISALNQDMPTATQIKVKVNYDDNYLTLVASLSIPYEQLVGRIDRKLERSTDSSISGGHYALKYRDEEGDFMSIESDEDIQEAIAEWWDGPGGVYAAGTPAGEMELFLMRTPGN